ncbi:MAG: FCD domain-containing protein [Syntrophomonadales bacterium]
MIFHAIDVIGLKSLATIREAINEFCEEAEKAEPDIVRLQEIDFEIHRRFIQAGGNKTMLFMHNTIRHTYRKTLKLFEALMEDPPLIARYYRQTIEAMEAEDKTAAKVAMQGYFQYGYSMLTER